MEASGFVISGVGVLAVTCVTVHKRPTLHRPCRSNRSISACTRQGEHTLISRFAWCKLIYSLTEALVDEVSIAIFRLSKLSNIPHPFQWPLKWPTRCLAKARHSGFRRDKSHSFGSGQTLKQWNRQTVFESSLRCSSPSGSEQQFKCGWVG